MWPPQLWKCLFLTLVPQLILTEAKIEIRTNINAHYAITTVKAPFSTGNTSKDVTFEMNLIPEAFISSFSITADGLECKATVEDIETAENIFYEAVELGQTAGRVYHENHGDKQRFETTVTMKENTEGFFLLKFEHQVLKDDIHNHFNVKIPVGTSQFYGNWSVRIDIMEDYKIDTIQHDMEIFVIDYDKDYNRKKTSLSDGFRQSVRKVKSQSNHKQVFFSGSLAAPNDPDKYYNGLFSVNYTTNPGAKQMETFVSATQCGAIISQNLVLNERPSLDIIAVLDTSNSMNRDNKLTDTLEAVIGIFLESNEELTEDDRVTFIRFDTEVDNLGTYNWGRELRMKGRKVLANIEAEGWTDINGAIDTALSVAETHITEGSKDIPLIVLYTDGIPEGNSTTPWIITDKTKIIDNVQRNNTRCIPIYSIAIGNNADLGFLRKISQGQTNCGEAYGYNIDSNLTKNLEDTFEKLRRPVYSSKPEISIKSDCVDENKLKNDLIALSGKKFANTGIELINIPFKADIPLNQSCEVEIIYTSIVANKLVKEQLKICFPEGRKVKKSRYIKLRDLSKKCPTPEELDGRPVKIPEGDFLDRLREYRDITKKLISSDSIDRDTLIERAKKASFVVEYLTEMVVVVKSNSDKCEEIGSTPQFTRHNSEREIPDIQPDQYTCKLTICNKSRFRGKCVYVYDEELSQMKEGYESLGPDEISSMSIEEGELGNCQGYSLCTEENYEGESKVFLPGEYPGFREMGLFYQETRSLKTQSTVRPRPQVEFDYYG